MGWHIYVADEVCYVGRCSEWNWGIDPSKNYDDSCEWSFGPTFDRNEAERHVAFHYREHVEAYVAYNRAMEEGGEVAAAFFARRDGT